jgi:hypothetical protein
MNSLNGSRARNILVSTFAFTFPTRLLSIVRGLQFFGMKYTIAAVVFLLAPVLPAEAESFLWTLSFGQGITRTGDILSPDSFSFTTTQVSLSTGFVGLLGSALPEAQLNGLPIQTVGIGIRFLNVSGQSVPFFEIFAGHISMPLPSPVPPDRAHPGLVNGLQVQFPLGHPFDPFTEFQTTIFPGDYFTSGSGPDGSATRWVSVNPSDPWDLCTPADVVCSVASRSAASLTITDVTVPEPSTVWLLMTGLAGLSGFRRYNIWRERGRRQDDAQRSRMNSTELGR